MRGWLASARLVHPHVCKVGVSHREANPASRWQPTFLFFFLDLDSDFGFLLGLKFLLGLGILLGLEFLLRLEFGL